MLGPLNYEDLLPFYKLAEKWLEVRHHNPDCQVDAALLKADLSPELQSFFDSTVPEREVFHLPVADYQPAPISPMLKAAMETGRLQLFPNYVATKLVTNKSGDNADGIVIIDRRRRKPSVLRAKSFFLAASAFETVRLLLNSRSNLHPDGIGNSYGHLGRGIMDHPSSSCIIEAAELSPAQPTDMLNLRSLSAYYLPPELGCEADEAFGIQAYLNSGRISLRAFGQMKSHSNNCLTLSNTHDRWGMPIPKIEFKYGPDERKLLQAQAECLRGMVHGAKALITHAVADNIAHVPGTSAHECGGAAIGETAQSSVVDQFNRIWDVPNVRVCDAACFTASGYSNPALTIMAVATRSVSAAFDTDFVSFS